MLDPLLALALAFAAPPGDLDGDGRADVVVEERRRTADGLVARDVVVLSGADGKDVFRVRIDEDAAGAIAPLALGWIVPDQDGDGAADLLVDGPRLHLRSTRDGSTIEIPALTKAATGFLGSPLVWFDAERLWVVVPGFYTVWIVGAIEDGRCARVRDLPGVDAAALAPDADGDGVPELATSRRESPESDARILSLTSLRTGGEVQRVRWVPEQAGEAGVGAVFDQDGDGRPEFVVSEEVVGLPRPQDPITHVRLVLLGASERVGERAVPKAWWHFGRSVVLLPEASPGGAGLVLVNSGEEDETCGPTAYLTTGGAIYVFTADAELRWRGVVRAPCGWKRFGRVMQPVGDVTGDGIEEVLTWAHDRDRAWKYFLVDAAGARVLWTKPVDAP